MTLRKALLAATVIALPVAAMAQPIDGLYVSGGIGANYMASTKVTGSYAPLGLSGSTHLTSPKLGLAGQISVGYGYGNGLRGELEVLGTDNSAKVKGTVYGATNYVYGVMANGLYDFAVDAPFTPYLGAGIGYVFLQESDVNVAGVSLVKSKAEGSFAAQGIAGVSFPLTSQLAGTVEYRLLDKVENTNLSLSPLVAGARAHVGSQLDHSVLLGLRYAFGAAPAAAAPAPAPMQQVAPAPAPARSYLVFFDWDKADLTARAQQIIAEAAKNATRVSATRIDVAGHADKSGTATYNQALSLKRANNVAAELVRLGVPKQEISISAFGDTKPLVPTAAGVREPQNRRVEIVLH